MPTATMNPFAPDGAIPSGDPATLRRAADAFAATADTLTGAGSRAAAARGVAPGDWSGAAAGEFAETCGTVQARAVQGGVVLRSAAGALYTLAAELEAAIGAARRAQDRADELAAAAFRLQKEMDWADAAALPGLDAQADELRTQARQVERDTVAAFDRAAVAGELAAGVFDQVAAAAFAPCALEGGGAQQGPGGGAGGAPGGGQADAGGLAAGAGGAAGQPLAGFVLPVPGGVGVMPGPGGRPVPAPRPPGPAVGLVTPGGRTTARPGSGTGTGVLPGRGRTDGVDPAKSLHTIKEHVTPRDLSAARMELLGTVVIRKLGGDPYDHVREVRESQRALLDRIKAIKKRMAHPGLPHREQGALSAELGEASRLLDLTESFVPRPTR